MFKNVPRRHRDYARADAFGAQLFMRLNGEAYFTARGDENNLEVRIGRVSEHISPARNTRRWRILAPIERRQRLTRQHQCGWLMTELHDITISLDNFVGIAGA